MALDYESYSNSGLNRSTEVQIWTEDIRTVKESPPEVKAYFVLKEVQIIYPDFKIIISWDGSIADYPEENCIFVTTATNLSNTTH